MKKRLPMKQKIPKWFVLCTSQKIFFRGFLGCLVCTRSKKYNINIFVHDVWASKTMRWNEDFFQKKK